MTLALLYTLTIAPSLLLPQLLLLPLPTSSACRNSQLMARRSPFRCRRLGIVIVHVVHP